MSLGRKVFAAPARLWMNWPLWGGLLAMLLLAKHVWVLFAPAEHAVPGTTVATQSAQAEQLFGTVSTTTSLRIAQRHPAHRHFCEPQKRLCRHDDRDRPGRRGSGRRGGAGRASGRDACRLCDSGTQRRPATCRSEQGARCRRRGYARLRTRFAEVRGMTVPPAGGQLLDQLTPEQQAILQQQQQELIRGRH